MGYWNSYHYVSAIVKAPIKLSKVFRRHLCTLVYLPSPSAPRTTIVATQVGARIHQASGQRIGFVFLEEEQVALHARAGRPDVRRMARSWRQRFGDADVRARVLNVRRGESIQNSRAIAEYLGIVDRTPCFLMMCHHFCNEMFTLPLAARSATDVADRFEEFCGSFYDANAPVFRALGQVEEMLDQSIYSAEELTAVSRILDKTVAAFRRFQSGSDNDLFTAAQGDPLTRTVVVNERFLQDQRFEDILPPGVLNEAPMARQFSLSGRVTRDLERLIQQLSGEVVVGRSNNDLIQMIRDNDQALLRRFEGWTVRTKLDFPELLAALKVNSTVSRRTLSRVEGHLKKKEWLHGLEQSVGFWEDELTPFVVLRRLLDACVAGGESPEPLRAFHEASEALIDALLVEYECYRQRMREDFEVLCQSCEEFQRAVNNRIRELLARNTQAGDPDEVRRMRQAIESLSSRVFMPSALMARLQPVLQTPQHSAADVMQLMELEDADGRANLGERQPKFDQPQSMTRTNHLQDKFDVFLSYNSRDADSVGQLEIQLHKRGISVWRDKSRIGAGDCFLDRIECGMRKSQTILMVLGMHGLGTWQQQEYRAAISEAIARGTKVIPLLLPGVSTVPESLLFLSQFQLVKFESNVAEQAALDDLQAAVRRDALL
jgi:hypothetical protein